MTRIKLCGLSRETDIRAANELLPEYIGFVFAPGSRRYVEPARAEALKQMLDPRIRAVGVFVDESPRTVAERLNSGVIDIAQLHGGESGEYIRRLRTLTDKPVIQAVRVQHADDVEAALNSAADYILLDAGAGEGRVFDWRLLAGVGRPYFLAGGLTPDNVREAVHLLAPYAVDVSSGIETGGVKDTNKMAAFTAAVRKGE